MSFAVSWVADWHALRLARAIPILLAVALPHVPRMVTAQQPVRIAFVIDGPWERNDEVRAIFEQELREMLQREFDIRFPVTLAADWTVTGVRAALDSVLARPDVDFMVTLGVIGSVEGARRDPLPKPVIAPFVLDIGFEGIPLSDGASGVPNL